MIRKLAFLTALILLVPRIVFACCQGAASPLTVQGPISLTEFPSAQSTPSAVYCADAVLGNDANTGIAAGTYPNFTNCKLHLQNACSILTSSSVLYATGTFRDATNGISANVSGTNVICQVNNGAGGASATSPTIITSFGNTAGNDDYSGAVVGAWADGADCMGANTGNCTYASPGPTWAVFATPAASPSLAIYETAFTQQPVAIYIDNIQTWPDGQYADGAQGLSEGTCVAATSAGCATATPGALWPIWAASHAYPTATVYVQASVNNITQLWRGVGGGPTTGATAPSCQGVNTCTSGVSTSSDGGITWTFFGGSGGKIGKMAPGSWFWNGQDIFLATVQGDSPSNHVIEVADHYEGIQMNANGTGGNNWTVSHMGIRHTQDGLYWNNNAAGTCISGVSFLYNMIMQTGESNVDLANFANGFRIKGSDIGCTPAVPTLFQNNFMGYTGDHGGSVTVQLGANNMEIIYNHLIHANHASVNLVGGGSQGSSGVVVASNFLDTSGPSGNDPVANDSVAGVYDANGASDVIVGNMIHNEFGSYCTNGQCTGINVQGSGATNVTVDNNTIDQVQACLYTSGNTGLIYEGNICSNLVTFAGNAAVFITHTGEIARSNYNVLSSNTTIAGISGVLKNFTQWEALGYDANSQNTDATYLTTGGYPFYLTPTSPGIGLTYNQGLYGPHAGANPYTNGWRQ